MGDRRWFFVAEGPRTRWHVESDGNCEVMLCGVFISADGPARVQSWWGLKKCPDCFLKFGKVTGRLPR